MNDSCEKLRARGGWAEDAARHRCTFPIGPWNTLSNLAYVYVGVVLALRFPSPSAYAMCLSLCVLGLGSALYHGYKTVWANRLDWVGMYMTFAALVVHAIVPASPSAPWLMVGVGAATAAYFSYALNGIDLNGQMGLFLTLSLLPALFGPEPHYRFAATAFVAFLLGYGIWQLDVRKSPIVGVYGHALWHLLTALAIGLTYLSQLSGS